MARWLLYAFALLGGALVAHVTSPSALGARAASGPSASDAPLPRTATRPDGALEAPAPELPGPGRTSGPNARVSTTTVEATANARTTDALTREPAPIPAIAHDSLAAALKGGRIMTGATPHRLILFTFDDGPDRRHTPLLLDRLDAEGVKAVFFLTAARLQGRNLAERQQIAIAKDIAARGHLIGSHTLDHAQLPLLNDRDALAQITGAERVFERVFGGRPWLFRPPGGASSDRIDRLLQGRNYTTILWNIGAGDFQVRSAEDVYRTWRRVFERRARESGDRGGIILLHDTYPWSVDAFQMIVGDLRRRNCELLASGDELFDVLDDPSVFFEAQVAGRPPSKASGKLAPEVLAERQQAVAKQAAAWCGSL